MSYRRNSCRFRSCRVLALDDDRIGVNPLEYSHDLSFELWAAFEAKLQFWRWWERIKGLGATCGR